MQLYGLGREFVYLIELEGLILDTRTIVLDTVNSSLRLLFGQEFGSDGRVWEK